MCPALSIQRPAGRAGAASGDWGRDPGSAVAPGILEPGITWYDVLGVLPGAEARKLKRKYEDKTGLLRPEMVSGAPPNVVTAVRRAQELLDTAWEVLGDPESRKRYDEAVGLRRSGGGLGQPGTGIESAGMVPTGPGINGELPGVNVAGGLPGLTGWLGPRRRRRRPGAVPDVRGLFYHVGLEVATRRGLRVRAVRLTERPMAVDGLVVDQDPGPPARAHRGGTLTVQVWHPPARSRW
jgi:DnaJ domain